MIEELLDFILFSDPIMRELYLVITVSQHSITVSFIAYSDG